MEEWQIIIPGQTPLTPCQRWKVCQWKKEKSSLRSLWPLTAFQESVAGTDLTSCSCPGASDHEPHSKRVVGSFPPLWLPKG